MFCQGAAIDAESVETTHLVCAPPILHLTQGGTHVSFSFSFFLKLRSTPERGACRVEGLSCELWNCGRNDEKTRFLKGFFFEATHEKNFVPKHHNCKEEGKDDEKREVSPMHVFSCVISDKFLG